MVFQRLARHFLTIFVTLLIGGLLGATLVRLAPGFGADERELDLRLNEQSIQILRQARSEEENVFRFYLQHLSGLFRGDLGFSRSVNRPIVELLEDRLPVTVRSASAGLFLGWLVGFALALPTAMMSSTAYEIATTALSGLVLCLPAAVLALLFLFLEGPEALAIGLVVFPKIFRYMRSLLKDAKMQPHILTAKAKGLGVFRVGLWHVLAPAMPQVLSLAGVSVNLALGAAIPIEVVCDSPGIGQLAWQAALARDLPLLLNLTLLVTLFTMIANLCSDLMITTSGAEQA
ncbi:MAG: ABC transporter permease [Acidobacteria bacterium]|nr:ABC transporter permease [Acidobacteriota bacterium]